MELNQSIPINISDVSLRPIEATDSPFLLELYTSTRASEMSQVDWSDEQKYQFLSMQFNAQQNYYLENYQKATFDVIEWQNTTIGRLYVEEWPTELRIIDIALLPDYCNQGIGSHFLKKVMKHASNINKGVSIHVEQNNPAMLLYKRLGFEKVDEHGVYDLMEWATD
jgi:ribosomal protein S18 acetylase RimI-like enzyme